MTQNRCRLLTASTLTLAGAGALAYWQRHPAESPWFAIGAGAAFAASAWLLILAGREDRDAVLLWFGGMTLGAAAAFGVYIYAAFEPAPLSWKAALTLATVGLMSLAWTWARQRSPADPDFPDVLSTLPLGSRIRETNRVQFSAKLRPGGGSEPHWVDVYLQNCCAAPRTVGFRVKGSWTRKVKVPVPALLELGPAEVRRLSLPIVTTAKEGVSTVDLRIPVLGTGGKRLRLRRVWTSQVRSTTPVGNVRFHLDPLPEALWEADLPAPSNAILWRPNPAALALV